MEGFEYFSWLEMIKVSGFYAQFLSNGLTIVW